MTQYLLAGYEKKKKAVLQMLFQEFLLLAADACVL